jgi:hypothetical protein
VVDFREEEVVLARNLEDEAAEADNRSDCFLEDDCEVTEGGFCFRDVVVEIEGAVDRGRREVILVSVVLVDTTRLVGPAVGRVLGRRGDIEVAFVNGLVILTSSGDPASVSIGRKSVPIFRVSEFRHTGFFQSLSNSRGT